MHNESGLNEQRREAVVGKPETPTKEEQERQRIETEMKLKNMVRSPYTNHWISRESLAEQRRESMMGQPLGDYDAMVINGMQKDKAGNFLVQNDDGSGVDKNFLIDNHDNFIHVDTNEDLTNEGSMTNQQAVGKHIGGLVGNSTGAMQNFWNGGAGSNSPLAGNIQARGQANATRRRENEVAGMSFRERFSDGYKQGYAKRWQQAEGELREKYKKSPTALAYLDAKIKNPNLTVDRFRQQQGENIGIKRRVKNKIKEQAQRLTGRKAPMQYGSTPPPPRTDYSRDVPLSDVEKGYYSDIDLFINFIKKENEDVIDNLNNEKLARNSMGGFPRHLEIAPTEREEPRTQIEKPPLPSDRIYVKQLPPPEDAQVYDAGNFEGGHEGTEFWFC